MSEENKPPVPDWMRTNFPDGTIRHHEEIPEVQRLTDPQTVADIITKMTIEHDRKVEEVVALQLDGIPAVLLPFVTIERGEIRMAMPDHGVRLNRTTVEMIEAHVKVRVKVTAAQFEQARMVAEQTGRTIDLDAWYWEITDG